MPRRDGTGPDGLGPRTGRGMGHCPRSLQPDGSGTPVQVRPGEGGGDYEQHPPQDLPLERRLGPWNNGEPIRKQMARLQESLDALRDALGKKEES